MKHLNALEAMGQTCVAVGRFEGVHRGHLAVARRLVAEAKKRGLTSVLVTLYDPTANTLTTEDEKAYLLRDTGVDVLLSLDSLTPPKDLLRQLNAQVLVTGEGDTPPCDADDVERITCPPVIEDGEMISTARIQKAFEENDLAKYTQLCGHAYLMIGTVQHGRQLGRTVGMPTANQGVSPFKYKPREGVYATVSTIEGESYMGLTNIGSRPSVDSFTYVTIETNLLDFSKDIYGKTQIVEVHIYIRGVQKFNDLGEVKQQVEKDLAQVRLQLTAIMDKHQLA